MTGRLSLSKSCPGQGQGSTVDPKPFACDFPGCSYKRRCLIRVHQVRHSSEKPFVCPIFSRAFARKTHLRRYMRTHKRHNFQVPRYPGNVQNSIERPIHFFCRDPKNNNNVNVDGNKNIQKVFHYKQSQYQDQDCSKDGDGFYYDIHQAELEQQTRPLNKLILLLDSLWK